MDSRFSLLALLVCLAGSRSQLHEGARCHLADDSWGVCRKLRTCPGVREQIVQGSLPTLCSRRRRNLIVCCQDNLGALGGPPNVTDTPPRRGPRPTRTRLTPTTFQSSTARPNVGSTIPRLDESRVSGRMCREYGQYVYWKRENPTFTVIPQYYNATECHQSLGTLIVGGVNATQKEFPHMAALGYGPKKMLHWLCGGSLISERFVLTVAHCITSQSYGTVSWVRLGDLNVNSTQDDHTFIVMKKVVERIKHEGYKAPSHYNDIALLRLESDVTFSPYVRPACLYNLPGNPVGLYNVTATGWGKLNYFDDMESEMLMKVELILQEASSCNRTYQHLLVGEKLTKGFTPESMICAGYPSGGRDTCFGDSGGPLQVNLKDPYCMYSIFGLTSFGVTACGKGGPSVYTRVSNFIPWIESHVWPQN